MAIWMGAFVGDFIGAIFIPLFLFYFADRKARGRRAAVISRSLAVLVAVLAAAAATVGAGGGFPAGAILAVLVCFVLAVRATLRDSGSSLNGWQRLGTIVSIIWLPVGFFGTVALFINTQTAPLEGIYQLCETVAAQSQQNRAQEQGFAADKIAQIAQALQAADAAGNTADAQQLAQAYRQQQQQQKSALATEGDAWASDDKRCWSEFVKNNSASRRGQWWTGLAGLLIPLFFFWGLAWVCVHLYRWVRAGFAGPQA